MNKLIFATLSIILVISLAACSPSEDAQDNIMPEENNEEQQDDTNLDTDEEQEKHRPDSKTDTIILEGMEDPFTFSLYKDSALGFSTYIVEDMIADSLSSGEGNAMIVYANFGGTQTEEAVVQFFSPNAATISTFEELKALSLEIFEQYDYKVIKRDNSTKTKMVPWATEEFDLLRENEMGVIILGTLSLFEREGTPYQVIVQYPEEFAEGFVPRVKKMFEDLVWDK